MALAFELPEHLPRSNKAQDKSTYILNKVGQTSDGSLNAALAASWLAELDSTIQDTKSRISKRIQDDLPAFERQLKSSVTIQTRLNDLENNVDRLSESLNNSEIGILPTLLRTLSSHRALAEQASDSNAISCALAHLLHIQKELAALSAWVQQGELSESAGVCERIHALLAEAPSPLGRADIMVEIKKKFRTLNNRVQEQLGDAYSRSIALSSSTDTTFLTILTSTTVPPTSTEITLSDILRSLTSDALSSRLSALRRDIMVKFVEPVLSSARPLLSSTSERSNTLTLDTSSPSSSPLQSLQTLNTFLTSNIFQHLPSTQAAFSTSFHVPVTTAILTHLLKASIPSSLSSLPSFLTTVDEAVRFEDGFLPESTRDKLIRHWADNVAGHYEKKRRESVMYHARKVVGDQEDDATVRIEVSVKQPETSPAHIVESRDDTDESGWEFDAELPEEDTGVASGSEEIGAIQSLSNEAGKQDDKSSDGEDPSDGWGWGDDVDNVDVDGDVSTSSSFSQLEPPTNAQQHDEEEDAWGDDWDTQPEPSSPVEPIPQPERAPKQAKRFEKFSAKAKGLSVSNTPAASPVVAIAPKPAAPPPARRRPAPLEAKKVEKESYMVSARAKVVLEIAEGLLREGQELMHSNILSEHLPPNDAIPGQLLVAAAPLVLDLYRALYPVAHSTRLARDPDLAMRWANDCRFLSDEVSALRNKGHLDSAEGKWAEVGERLKLLGETWFEDVLARQQDAVRNILVGTQGFAGVADAERFEECKSAIDQVLREVTSVAHQWKVTLTRSNYLHAIGQVVDDALFRVMDDVLSLEDIPEADSERLSELCEMLEPLEELFSDASGKHSVVGSHVPLWFKFSYLSWLIKGSIADLSYLFDQGMLVDYEIDELVRLLRALFAETPLRENTIAKISKGHPVPVQASEF